MQHKEPSYQDIIAGLKERDPLYQEYVFKRYYGLMLHICMRYMGSKEEAEDVLNQGFMKIFTQIDKYKDTGSFEAWMKRIMINASIDAIRKQKMHLTHITDINQFEQDNFIENSAVSKMALDDIFELLEEVPPMSRTVFNLYVMEGYKHKEIAELLEISEGTSYWHLQNARKVLKSKLETTKIIELNVQN